MRLFICIFTLTVGAFGASADTVTISGLGNGQGWTDGAYYTGYLTLSMDGTDYVGLCIDPLHETTGVSWNAVYIPMTDTADIAGAMAAYFGLSDPATYLPVLYAGATGFNMLASVGTDEAANNDIQHAVWDEIAPGTYADNGVLLTASGPPGNFLSFGLIVDANYQTGQGLEQAFLVAGESTNVIGEDQAPEPGALTIVGIGLLVLGAHRQSRRT